jgi:hypothetical protein
MDEVAASDRRDAPEATAAPPESLRDTSAALFEARRRLARQRWRRVRTLARLAIVPSIALVAAGAVLFLGDPPFVSRLLGAAFTLFLVWGLLNAVPSFRARVQRVRRLSDEARELEARSAELRDRLVSASDGLPARGAISLAQVEGEGGGLSLTEGDGGLSLAHETQSAGAAPLGADPAGATSLPALGPLDRGRLVVRAAWGRLILVMVAALGCGSLLLGTWVDPPRRLGLFALAGIFILGPALLFAVPRLIALSVLAFGAARVSLKPQADAQGNLFVAFALPPDWGSDATPQLRLKPSPGLEPARTLRGAVALSHDRLFYAVEVPGRGWQVEYRPRTD